jgi:hypothetical protein
VPLVLIVLVGLTVHCLLRLRSDAVPRTTEVTE